MPEGRPEDIQREIGRLHSGTSGILGALNQGKVVALWRALDLLA